MTRGAKIGLAVAAAGLIVVGMVVVRSAARVSVERRRGEEAHRRNARYGRVGHNDYKHLVKDGKFFTRDL